MPNANQEYFDAALRHQVGIRRFTAGEVKELLRLLERADRSLVAKLRIQLAPLAGKPRNDLGINRIKDLLRSVRDTRREVLGQLKLQLGDDLAELGKVEADFELRMLRGSLPVEITFNTVSVETIRALVTTKPFAGGASAARTLGQWFEDLRVNDQARLIGGLQLGIVQGETVDDMIRRVVGTKANGYADGILSVTRRQAETVVRTAVNHVSNAARESVWEANSDIIAGLKWVATLDGRTSAVCRARDGHVSPLSHHELPKGVRKLNPLSARPPAHPNCRSVMVAILDGEGIGDAIGERPTVRGNKREVNFRTKAKKRIGEDKWSELDVDARNELIRKERDAWTDKVVGRVPANVSYNDWLKTQPAEFIDETLGKTKGALFRRGGLKLEAFVDKAGNELTLKQLAQSDPTAFIKAGLDPEDFE